MRERDRERGRERDRGRERGTEGGMDIGRDREFHGEISSTSAQSEIFKPSDSHKTNNSIYCRCKLTCSPMYCTNKIRQTEMLMVGHNTQDQHWQLITKRECSPSRQQKITKQDFPGTTADAGKKTINKMTTKQGRDKSQL